MSHARDLVIVGAPRSGTNMLRDVLSALPGFATWPCDEINPVWRHGNRDHPSDELRPEHARPEVRDFVRARFDRIRARYGARWVVEKTCATSLRVGFVRELLPEARYLFITRDGLDAAPSAQERWHAPLDLPYTLMKARFVPPSDVPHYAWRFIQHRLASRRGGHEVVSWWGPRPDDWREIARQHPLDEISMIQWSRCVAASTAQLDGLPGDQLLHIRYEEFVSDPVDGLATILDFLGEGTAMRVDAVSGVSAGSVGKGRASLADDRRAVLGELGRRELEALGYAVG